MKAAKMRMKVYRYLERHGPQSFQDIRDYLNTNTKFGADHHSLSNILGKDKAFVQVGTMGAATSYHPYYVTVWDIDPNILPLGARA